jgi:hypothetical protein
VDVVTHAPGRGGRIDLAIRSVQDGGSASGAVRVEPDRPGMYPALLTVSRVGPHELEVRAGGERSVLPFAVLVPEAPLWRSLWEVAVFQEGSPWIAPNPPGGALDGERHGAGPGRVRPSLRP